MNRPLKFYRRLLRLYPARFREEFGEPLEQQFRDEYPELETRRDRFRFWLRAVADFAFSIPREFSREVAMDARHALRVYRQRWVFTSLALLSLAVAIGATTGVFGVVNGLLLRRLPFRDPDRLIELSTDVAPDHGFHEWRKTAGFLENAARYSTTEANLSTNQDVFRARVAEVSANFFDVLGVTPSLGRTFQEGEDAAARNSVAVIGYGLWQQMFGGDPGVIASVIRVNGMPMTVIGVAPPLVDYPEKAAIWTPTVLDLQHLPKAGFFLPELMGRLPRGMSLKQVGAMALAEARRQNFRIDPPPRAERLRDGLTTDTRRATLVLFAAVMFVLWIACANVAHLLLSRVNDRRQELMVRAALGASRARLVQQLITESALLTLSATAAGMAVAYWAAHLAAQFAPPDSAAQQYNIVDARVLAFAMGLALLTGLVFGVLPARMIGRLQPVGDVVRTSAKGHGRTVKRLRTAFLTAQTALAVVLVAGALTMSINFLRLTHTSLHFRTDHEVTLNVAIPAGDVSDRATRRRDFTKSALDGLRHLPAVEAAAAIDFLPLERSGILEQFQLDSGQSVGVLLIRTTPDYFRAIGTDFLAGRDFAEADPKGPDTVAIVDQDFVRKAGVGSVLGHRIVVPYSKRQLTSAVIIGVVESQRHHGPIWETQAQVFLPLEQHPSSTLAFVARVRGDARKCLPACRDAVQRIDRDIPVFDAKTMDQRLADELAQPRFYTTAVLFFGGLALLLAVIGIYGVASHSVTQRTQEIGVRMAVGASARGLRTTMLVQSLLPVAVGGALGVACALEQRKIVEHLIANSQSIGPEICAAAAILLCVTAAAAVWTATRRIVRMDPMRVLRSE